jgi:anti-anti-sigma factor
MSRTILPEVIQRGGISVVSFGTAFADIDETMLDPIRDLLHDLGQVAAPPLVVVALPHTHFFTSSFLGLLLAISNQLKQRGGKLGLCRLTPFCAKLVETTKMDSIWVIGDTVDETIARFGLT